AIALPGAALHRAALHDPGRSCRRPHRDVAEDAASRELRDALVAVPAQRAQQIGGVRSSSGTGPHVGTLAVEGAGIREPYRPPWVCAVPLDRDDPDVGERSSAVGGT